MNVLPTSPKKHPKKSTKNVCHRGSQPPLESFDVASAVEAACKSNGQQALWPRYKWPWEIHPKKRPAALESYEIPFKKKRMLDFCLIQVAEIKKKGRKNETRQTPCPTKRPEHPTNISIFLGGCIRVSSKFSSHFKDWTPFGESNGPSQ